MVIVATIIYMSESSWAMSFSWMALNRNKMFADMAEDTNSSDVQKKSNPHPHIFGEKERSRSSRYRSFISLRNECEWMFASFTLICRTRISIATDRILLLMEMKRHLHSLMFESSGGRNKRDHLDDDVSKIMCAKERTNDDEIAKEKSTNREWVSEDTPENERNALSSDPCSEEQPAKAWLNDVSNDGSPRSHETRTDWNDRLVSVSSLHNVGTNRQKKETTIDWILSCRIVFVRLFTFFVA